MPRRSPRLAPAPACDSRDHSEGRFQIRDSGDAFIRALAGVPTAPAQALRPDRRLGPRHAEVARSLVKNNPKTRERRRRSIATALGWSLLTEADTQPLVLARGMSGALLCGVTLGRSLFVRAAPTDVNEFVVRLCRSLRDQAIALGLDVGGRIPRVLPDEKHPPLAGMSFLELVQPVRRRQRRLRHGSTPSLDVLVTRRHWPARRRARDRVRAWRGAPRTAASPAPARRCRPPSRCRRPPTARARRPRPRPRWSTRR